MTIWKSPHLSSDVPHGGSLFMDILTPDEQIKNLKAQSLLFRNIHEEERFAKLIKSVGYFKLSQYFKHFYS